VVNDSMLVGRGDVWVVAADRRCGVVVGFWGKPAPQFKFRISGQRLSVVSTLIVMPAGFTEGDLRDSWTCQHPGIHSQTDTLAPLLSLVDMVAKSASATPSLRLSVYSLANSPRNISICPRMSVLLTLSGMP